MVTFKGIGSPGPSCPICSNESEWLTDPIETVMSVFQCGTCLRIFDYDLAMIIWWPNDQNVGPSYGGTPDKNYTKLPEEYPPGTRIRYRYR